MPRARIASGFGGARNPNLSSTGNSVSSARPWLFGARQQLRQVMIALRTDHDIDHRRAADDLVAFGLRDAAGHRDVHLAAVARGFILGDPQPSQLRIDLLGGFFANVAGVEDHQVRIVDAGGLDKAFGRQRVHHALRIVDVHLTTI